MANTSNIDELNINPPYKERSEPYEKYFGIMQLSKRQIRERILFAEDFEDIFYEFLMYMVVLNEYGEDFTPAQEQLQERYRDKMFEYLPENDGDFIRDYAAIFAANAVETTAKHISKIPEPISQIREKEAERLLKRLSPSISTTTLQKTAENQPEEAQPDIWYVSLDRAKFNAENEANTVLNRKDFLEAKEAGFSRKRWLTEMDDRVRPTHQEVEGLTIPIDELFIVGNSVFGYARDLTYDPEPDEYVNCRCVTEYIK